MNAPAVGLIGLGNMGAAVAGRLVGHGDVVGFDLDAGRRADAAAIGVRSVSTLEAFAQTHTVLLSLPSPAISLTVARQLSEILPAGSLVVETSTVNPADMAGLAAVLAPAGIRVVDVAILSGVGGMRDGSSILLAGGADVDLDAVAPLLASMSSKVLRFGALGSGMAAKVINNAVAHAVMVVLAEAAALGVTNGIAIDDLVDLLKDPEAGLTRPLTHRVAERVAGRQYDGGMPTEAARKDSVLALQLAQSSKVPLFAIQGAHTAYELAVAAGLARDDYAAIATLWEGWSQISLARDNG